MTTATRPETDRAGSPAARLVHRLVALGVLGYWMLWSWLLLTVRCGDTCSGDAAAYERWEYVGQFALAVPCAAAGVVGLALGITRPGSAARLLLGVAAAGGLFWFTWLVLLGGL